MPTTHADHPEVDLARFAALVPADHGLAVIALALPDHTAHASVANAGVLPHPLTGGPWWAWWPGAAGGEHDDWDAYDRAMAAERRTALLLSPERLYANP